jgi:hypothetical protein
MVNKNFSLIAAIYKRIVPELSDFCRRLSKKAGIPEGISKLF